VYARDISIVNVLGLVGFKMHYETVKFKIIFRIFRVFGQSKAAHFLKMSKSLEKELKGKVENLLA
jgi:hypothetical protein